VIVLAVVLSALASVELRGGVRIDAPITAVSVEGVHVGGDEPRLIGWDGVKRIHGEFAEQAAPFDELADMAWRARLRLARNDIRLASPLFEQLYLTYRGKDGPTALMVAEGLVRCRVWHGDIADAIDPWLEAVRLREAGVSMAGDPPLAPVLDPRTALVGALPPIFLDDVVLPDSGPTDFDGLAGFLRMQYRRAASLPVSADIPVPDSDGARFIRHLVDAQRGDPDEREAARFVLESSLDDDAGTWREAWSRVALGRSLLREDDPGLRTTGLFHLLHLPARFSQAQPYLSGIALAEVSLELARQGDAESADRLRTEITRLGRAHPAIDWLDEQIANLPDPDTSPEDTTP
jgi:hypothetical protein